MSIMLLQFSCENHKSIKNKVVFSTTASNDVNKDELMQFDNNYVIRSAAIYGANGSGKSNFISALEFVRALVVESIKHQPGQGVFQALHKLSERMAPSIYNIQFVKNRIKYVYEFSIKENLVSSEYLYYYPNGRKTIIFERNGLNIYPGDKYKSVFELSLGVLKDNRLFLSCAANYTNLKEIEDAFLFFNNDMVIYNPNTNINPGSWIEKSIKLLQENKVVKEFFVDILKTLQTGITDIKVKFETKMMNASELPQEMPDALKALFTAQETNQMEAKVVYDGFETDLMSEESTGIKKLFEIVCPIIDVLNNDKVFICDEIETNLHETVVKQIIQLFKYMKKDNFAQLLFTTHNTNLLSMDLFRRDQVWFTQLDAGRSTQLYPLTEIRNVRRAENLERGYISGKYGAIPMLNKDIFEFWH